MSAPIVCGCGSQFYSKVWATEYAHDRRKHRHRCRHCSKIIDAGERVLMIRIPQRRGTWAIHEEHADDVFDGITWRQKLSLWAEPDGCSKCGGSGVLEATS